jgi:hypothetical protein
MLAKIKLLPRDAVVKRAVRVYNMSVFQLYNSCVICTLSVYNSHCV